MSGSGGAGRLPTFSPLGLPSRASSCPCSDQTMALSARACLLQVRRRRRRRSAPRGATGAECGASACGLTPKEAAAAAAATEATCARHCRHGGLVGASPSGASLHAGSMPPASPRLQRRAEPPTGTVARKRRCKAIWDGIRAVVP